jgi:O-antigen ligase
MWFIAIGATGAGLLLTYVRAGWLAAIVGLVAVLLLSGRARRIGPLVLLIALLVALAFGSGLLDLRAVQERAESQKPIDYRVEAISVGLRLAASSPLFGLGLDNYSDSALAAGWRPLGATGVPSVAAHNVFIYVLTSGGLLALIPFLAMLSAAALRLLAALKTRDHADRDWAVAGLGMFLGYLLIANTIDALGAQYASMLFFLALGATLAVMERHYPPALPVPRSPADAKEEAA